MSKDPYCSDSEWECRLHSAIDKTEVLRMLCETIQGEHMDGQAQAIENPVSFWGGLREITVAIKADLVAVLEEPDPEVVEAN